jgi:PAS domain S-box
LNENIDLADLIGKSIDGLTDAQAIDHVALLVDASADAHSPTGTDRAFMLLDEIRRRELAPEFAVLTHYVAANAWDARLRQKQLHDVWSWEQPEIEAQILELRRALRHQGFERLHIVRRCQVLTNLANQLSHLGRFIEAIEYLDRALGLIAHFAMALGNRGLAFAAYARAVYDRGHGLVMMTAAHDLVTAAVAPGAFYDGDENGAAREAFADTAADISQHVDIEDVRKTINLTDHSMIDELETSNEEMKSANEEYQSVNEELQSSNEELETAKEEMQSINEELQTVNAEMSSKNETLTRLNSDLRNLLDSTHIATVFLDARLHIKYFTPPMTDIFHLRDSDRDRPITEIAGRMQYANLRQDVATVLRDLTVVEQEVRIDGKESVFLMRIRPYRTIDNVIDGVVITFVDITASKRHEQMSAQLAAIVDSSQDAIVGHSFDGTISSWNSGAETIFGYSAAEAIGQPFSILVPKDQADEVPQILEKLRRGERVEHIEIDRVRKDGARIDVSLTISPVRDPHGKVIAASTIARDFTERKRAEDHRTLLMAELDHRVKNILMVVSSLVSQTLLSTGSAESFAEEIQGRVQALSRVHSLLNVHGQTYAELRHIVESEFGIYGGDRHRLVIEDKARVCLTGRTTQAMAMALHELTTNAAKYGALSGARGRVTLSWEVANSAEPARLLLKWVESGGPAVKRPVRRGFGSQLIESMLGHELKAHVTRDFKEEGFQCTIEVPLTDGIGHVIDPNAASSGRELSARILPRPK